MKCVLTIALSVVCALAASSASSASEGVERSQRGLNLFYQGKFPEAEAEHRAAIQIFLSAGLNKSGEYGAALNNLSAALQSQGKIAEARKTLEQLISMEREMTPKDDTVLAHAMNNLAMIHHAEREYPQALSLLQKALQRGPKPGKTRAGTFHNLGAVYFDLGQLHKAKGFFEKAVQEHRDANEADRVAPSLSYLGRIAAKNGDNASAERLLTEALQIRRSVSGGSHPWVALGYAEIGEFQLETHQYDKAAETFETAMNVLESGVGVDHIYAAAVMFHFGEARRLQGRHAEALELYNRTARIVEGAYGPGHARLSVIYRSAAMSAEKLKRKEDKKLYTERAKAIDKDRVDYSRHTIDASAFLPRRTLIH